MLAPHVDNPLLIGDTLHTKELEPEAVETGSASEARKL